MPGATGLWQVSGRSGISSFREMVALDRTYIHSWSLLADLRIILKTFGVVLGRKNAF
jgi:lipopolysaccharide/colanic/teichoic acid biosynthesis glycosyltransferase